MDYISIREVLDNLLDDEMMQGLSLERAVKWTVDFMRKLNVPNMYEERHEAIEFHHHVADLPCDCVRVLGIESLNPCNKGVAYVASTANFEPTGLSYKVQGNKVIGSLDHDRARVSYWAIKTDADGFPMIPDNGKVEPALSLYITKQFLTPKFRKGEINANVIQHLDQQYAFAVGQAQTSLIAPTEDEMQSFTHMMNTMIERPHEHIRSFRNLDKPSFTKNF